MLSPNKSYYKSGEVSVMQNKKNLTHTATPHRGRGCTPCTLYNHLELTKRGFRNPWRLRFYLITILSVKCRDEEWLPDDNGDYIISGLAPDTDYDIIITYIDEKNGTEKNDTITLKTKNPTIRAKDIAATPAQGIKVAPVACR